MKKYNRFFIKTWSTGEGVTIESFDYIKIDKEIE